MLQDPKTRGYLFIALGSIIFITFAGDFILTILATGIALLLVNYGLKILGRPPLFILIQQWLDDVNCR